MTATVNPEVSSHRKPARERTASEGARAVQGEADACRLHTPAAVRTRARFQVGRWPRTQSERSWERLLRARSPCVLQGATQALGVLGGPVCQILRSLLTKVCLSRSLKQTTLPLQTRRPRGATLLAGRDAGRRRYRGSADWVLLVEQRISLGLQAHAEL